MVLCLLCLELDNQEEDCIKIYSSTWEALNVKNIMDKHLCFMNSCPVRSQLLCMPCWTELYDFHKFFERVENAQKNFDLQLKSETESQQDASDNKTNSIVSEHLLEPEIVLDQIVIKKELADSDSDNGNNDEDDIPLIHMQRDVERSLQDPINDSDISMKDPLTRSSKPKKFRGRGKNLRQLDIGSTENELQDNDCAQKIKSESETNSCNEEEDDEGNSTSTSHSTDKSGRTCRKSYYQPRTNRQEHDKFLAEYFKLTCNLCQETFPTFPILLKHFAKLHKERGYVTCCDCKYYDRSKLVDHINVHLNPEYFKCKHCPKVLTQRKSLQAHMKLHEEKQHECDICQKKFVRKCKLRLHKLTHMSEEEKKFPCTECGKFFASEAVLSHHQTVVHLNRYAKLCEICGQSMRDLESFRRHMEKHEGIQSTTYSCDICGLVVAGKRNLKLHTNSQHPEGGKKEYTCHICLKVSPTLNALRKHIRCTHEMGYNYKCTFCEKAFKRPDNLKAHMATHTGTDLYKCPWCPKTFNSNGNMHNHRKKVHPKEWEEARRKRYSGKLPPNFKPPTTTSESVQNASVATDY